MQQMDLFDAVVRAYGGASALGNAELYARLCDLGAIDEATLSARVPVGQAGAPHCPAKRRVRWYQQTLKALGLLERERRGVWRLTPKGRGKLTPAAESTVLLGFCTYLGVALWARCEAVTGLLPDRVDLVLSSLPYPLRIPRAYGGPAEVEYVDWVCRILEPLVARLATGASVALNLGNDVFEPGMPSRSLYVERLTLALHDRLGLHKMDTLIWSNPARPPGPVRWASVSRQQLNAGYEPVLWMSPDPRAVRADNRRVLLPHTETQLALQRRGGEARRTSYGDGAHRVRPGSYAAPTAGRIPRNVIVLPHNCAHKKDMARLASAAGLPVHGATMPLALARLLIEFLTEPGALVVDPCAGWMTTARACEDTGRRWLACEQVGEYVLGAALGFRELPGFVCGGALDGPGAGPLRAWPG